MWRNAHDTYLEERVLSADPVELVQMLYQAALTAVADARRHLAERKIADRARAVSKACEILIELNTSLDFELGGDFSVRLSQLYGYMHRLLVEANIRQQDEPLAEVSGLLSTLTEGWAGVQSALRQRPVRETAWMPQAFAEPQLAAVSGSWSF
ncbi:MAG TPA: flagellar export chaperone FliS [Bryobacteraceae bacterium]|jgi:flagellar protein FliS|nr:flagellar export chaperone FliS [Bryobacteraceae bacterium]